MAIFGVDEHEGVERGGALHDLEHEAILNHEDVGVGHEELEGGDALGCHVLHLGEGFVVLAEVGDGHVERVVDAGFAGGFGVPGGFGLGQGVAAGLQGEVDDGGGAAHGGGAGAGEVVVGGGGAAEGHVEMGVDVDAAGEHEEVGGVDQGVACGMDAGGYLGDLFAFDEDVGALLAGGVDDGAVLDECAHRFPLVSGVLRTAYRRWRRGLRLARREGVAE